MRQNLKIEIMYQIKSGKLTWEKFDKHTYEASAQFLGRFAPVLNIVSLSVTDLLDSAKTEEIDRWKNLGRYIRKLDKEITDIEHAILHYPGYDFRGENGAAFLDFNDNVNDKVRRHLNTLYWCINNFILKDFKNRFKHVDTLSFAAVTSILCHTLKETSHVLHDHWKEEYKHPIEFDFESSYDLERLERHANDIVGILCDNTPLRLERDKNVTTALENVIKWACSPEVLNDCIKRAAEGKPKFQEALNFHN